MNILQNRISVFKSIRDTEVLQGRIDTVGMYLEKFRNGEYKTQIEKVRQGDDELKKSLPAFAFHGEFKGFRKSKDFIQSTGLVILDIDDIDPDEDLEEIKKDIVEGCEHIVSVMISPSGNGLKILYYVVADLITADNYRQIGKQLVSDFDIYGKVDFLSVTDCLLATWDPNIIINENATPQYIYIKHETPTHVGSLDELDKSRTLWDNAEDFFDTVLSNDIAAKTNSNFHYIQIAMLDLAKFGFYHPKEDLSFVVDYAELSFKKSKDNFKRFQEMAEIAKTYPQTQWPYRTVRSEFDDEEDGEYDYSQYASTSKESQDEVEDEGGLIDYTNSFARVLDIAREGDRVGCEISLKSFSDIFRFRGTGILTVTGIPGHGKTEFVDQCILDLARLYGHESIIVGFEQTPEEHIIKLMKKLLGTNVTCPSFLQPSNVEIMRSAHDFIVSKIRHIDTVKVGGNISTILDVAAKNIQQSRDSGGNPRYIVLDPFNMLSIKGRFSGHEKIEEILRRLTIFSHQMDIMVILVAHPFKMRKDEKTGNYEVPDFYSVKGSSAFFEMSYHGLVVFRTGYQASDPILVRCLKVKQSNLGVTAASVNLSYDRNSGRYYPIDSEGHEEKGDHRDRNWLELINK